MAIVKNNLSQSVLIVLLMVASLTMHVLKLCMEGTQLLSISERPMPREDIGDKFRWDADGGNFFGQDQFLNI